MRISKWILGPPPTSLALSLPCFTREARSLSGALSSLAEPGFRRPSQEAGGVREGRRRHQADEHRQQAEGGPSKDSAPPPSGEPLPACPWAPCLPPVPSASWNFGLDGLCRLSAKSVVGPGLEVQGGQEAGAQGHVAPEAPSQGFKSLVSDDSCPGVGGLFPMTLSWGPPALSLLPPRPQNASPGERPPALGFARLPASTDLQ